MTPTLQGNKWINFKIILFHFFETHKTVSMNVLFLSRWIKRKEFAIKSLLKMWISHRDLIRAIINKLVWIVFTGTCWRKQVGKSKGKVNKALDPCKRQLVNFQRYCLIWRQPKGKQTVLEKEEEKVDLHKQS